MDQVMRRVALSDGRPCPYRIQVSARARGVRLRLSAAEGLVVIIPAGAVMPLEKLEQLIRTKSRWIARHLQRFARQHRAEPDPDNIPLPRAIDLPAVNERWEVLYVAQNHSPDPALRSPQDTWVTTLDRGLLQISGNTEAPWNCIGALRTWVHKKASTILPSWLDETARELRMPFSRITIRDQRTRWGSCTHRGRINLNCKLLLLPRPWVRYVLLHELCHTQIMNHGPDFWALLARHEPRAQCIRREMRSAWARLPAWLTARRPQ